MDYNQIQRFLMIVKHSNLSGAAKELCILQPALSLSLANMEKELGMPLFLSGEKSSGPDTRGRDFCWRTLNM